MSKRKQTPADATKPAGTLPAVPIPPADLLCYPEAQAAVAMERWCGHMGKPDLEKLVDRLALQNEAIRSGDLSRIERMLLSQAQVLQTMFVSLARRASNQEHLAQFQAMAGLAFKAQAQCRCTLETLAEIKAPRPVAFVRQANIAAGLQQVNNGNGTGTNSRAENAPPAQNELLGTPNGDRLEPGAASEASGGDPTLATVGALDGTTLGGR